ncbi:MAG TPA: outer membrane beta-barrel protein [Planctomycetota bacterium]|nr:outer membrane beta-barrel protein [Planctomycetota bacterium]
MTMGRTILASLFAAGIFASPASAQERDADNPLEPGLWEANLSASAAYQNFDSGGERFEIGGTASLGYFLTEWFELGGEISYIFSELDLPTSETQTTSLLAGPRIVINVPTGSPFVPYGIASGGVAWAETEVNDMDVFEEVGGYWQAGGGIRIFLNEFSALNIQVTYRQIHLNDVDMIDGIVGEAGFAVFF